VIKGLVLAMPVVASWLPAQLEGATILIDARTSIVLASTEASRPWPPASLTKLMTLYLTFNAISRGSLRLDQELVVSPHAAVQPGSRLGLTRGDVIAVEDAILGVITQSGNDAAMVLAEAVGGSELKFVSAMNDQARMLGLSQSHFVNPSGLSDPHQRTSARDMALLARALWQDYPEYYHFFDARGMHFGRRDLPTVNGFLASYRGADGLKTGTTCDAGYNLVASAERDGVRLIGVVLGESSSIGRISSMAMLLDRGFGMGAQSRARGINIAELLPSSDGLEGGGTGACRVAAAPPAGQPHSTAAQPASTTALAPPLAGWGIALGAYTQAFHARRAAELAQISLKVTSGAGRPEAVAMVHAAYFTSLLVGLSQSQAVAACLALRRNGYRCFLLAPIELNRLGVDSRG
jgi:D-alanyl-D-alanine carboxypeptidase